MVLLAQSSVDEASARVTAAPNARRGLESIKDVTPVDAAAAAAAAALLLLLSTPTSASSACSQGGSPQPPQTQPNPRTDLKRQQKTGGIHKVRLISAQHSLPVEDAHGNACRFIVMSRLLRNVHCYPHSYAKSN
jgi:hypothetical protein